MLYEKCKNCNSRCLTRRLFPTVTEKSIWKIISFFFMMLCTTTMILTAFQQEAFCKDTVDFFTTFLNSCGEVLEMIADAECGLAQLLADMISQPIWRNVVLLDCIGVAIHHNRNPALFYLSYGVG